MTIVLFEFTWVLDISKCITFAHILQIIFVLKSALVPNNELTESKFHIFSENLQKEYIIFVSRIRCVHTDMLYSREARGQYWAGQRGCATPPPFAEQ